MKISYKNSDVSKLQGNIKVDYSSSKRPVGALRKIFIWAMILLPVILFLIFMATEYFWIHGEGWIYSQQEIHRAQFNARVDSIWVEVGDSVSAGTPLMTLRQGDDNTLSLSSRYGQGLGSQRAILASLRKRIALAEAELVEAIQNEAAIKKLREQSAATHGEWSLASRRLFDTEDHLESLKMQLQQLLAKRDKDQMTLAALINSASKMDTIFAQDSLFIDSLWVHRKSSFSRGDTLLKGTTIPQDWKVYGNFNAKYLPDLHTNKTGRVVLPNGDKLYGEIIDEVIITEKTPSIIPFIEASPKVRVSIKLIEPLPEWAQVENLNVELKFFRLDWQ